MNRYTVNDLQFLGTSELIEKILVQQQLLQNAHEVLANYWFDKENDEYNNEDVIRIDQKIIKYLEGGI